MLRKRPCGKTSRRSLLGRHFTSAICVNPCKDQRYSTAFITRTETWSVITTKRLQQGTPYHPTNLMPRSRNENRAESASRLRPLMPLPRSCVMPHLFACLSGRKLALIAQHSGKLYPDTWWSDGHNIGTRRSCNAIVSHVLQQGEVAVEFVECLLTIITRPAVVAKWLLNPTRSRLDGHLDFQLAPHGYSLELVHSASQSPQITFRHNT